MKNIKQLLPFLDKEALNELVDKMLTNDKIVEGIDIVMLLPFLESNKVREIFEHKLKNHEKVTMFLPFLDDDDLDQVFQKILSGELDYPHIIEFVPFMKDETVEALYKKVTENGGSFGGVKQNELYPFIENVTLDESFLKQAKENKIEVGTLPFVSDEALHQVVTSYIQGEVTIEIDPLLPFLADSDIKALFNHEIKKKMGTKEE